MSGAAQKAKVASSRHFQLADMWLTVLEVEGTVQLVCAREWDQGRFNTMVKRIRDDLDAVPDLATKAENRDGGMPPRWWAKGRMQ